MEEVGRGPPRICLVSGDTDIAEWIQAGFERAEEGIEVVIETDPGHAIERIDEAMARTDPRIRSPLVDTEKPFDSVVVTADIEGIDVADVVEPVRDAHRDLPIVLFTDEGSERLASAAITAGVSDYLVAEGENPTGELATRVLESVTDYRERRRTAIKREYGRRILEDNADIVTVFRSGGDVTYQNPTVSEVLGYSPEEINDALPFQKGHPDDWQKIREEFYDAVRDPDYVPTVEYRIRDANGEWRTVESRARNMLGDEIVNGFVVTTRDVTERKERERDLEGYKRMVENAGDAMYVADAEGYIQLVNGAFVERTGYDRDFLEGEHVSTFMRQEEVEEGTRLITDLLSDPDRKWGRFEFVAENVEGEFRRYRDSVAVLTDDDGNYRGSVGVIRDITDDE
jgi:PAS domain S-box-containing protein